MNRFCLQCGKEMDDRLSGEENETRNICEECAAPSDTPVRIALTDYLDTIAVPVVLFDSERRAVAANRRACEYLGKCPEKVEGFRAGEVFECGYARFPEGCGSTVHCSGCTLRRLILDTLILEKEYRQVPVYLNRESGSREPDFLISTEKKFDLVLLRIDMVEAGSDVPDKE